MEQASSRKQPKGSGEASPGLRVVAIRFNPAPDAEERLRRLFTLLLENAAGERQAAPDGDDPDEEA